MTYGEKVWNAKLTEPQVREIKALILNGMPSVRIAEKYGVARPTIVSIKIGRNWAWLRAPHQEAA